jgi:hypothetical protein
MSIAMGIPLAGGEITSPSLRELWLVGSGWRLSRAGAERVEVGRAVRSAPRDQGDPEGSDAASGIAPRRAYDDATWSTSSSVSH